MTMTLVSPIVSDMTVTQPPAAPPQWAPGYPPQPAPQPAPPRRWSPSVLAVGMIAVAALIVGIISLADNSSARPVAAPTSTSTAPTFTDAEHAAAKDRVCTTFNSVVQSIRTATNVPEGSPEPIAASVNARAAIATGALALSRSVSEATPSDVAKAANGLADAYSAYLQNAFQGNTAQSAADHAAVNRATDALQSVCG